MKEKLQNIPTWVMVVAAVGVLALAGSFMFKTAQSTNDGNFRAPEMTPEQQARYQQEMMKRSSSGSGYQSSGAPGNGGRPVGGPPRSSVR